MKVPEHVRKTVAFLGYENKTTREIELRGSVFFIGLSRPGQTIASRVFAVTAKHNIDRLKEKGCAKAVIRMNGVGESGLIIREIPIGQWHSDPSDSSIDVAVAEFPIPVEADHLALPLHIGATAERLAENEVDLGEEVFISGLFKHHFGRARNIPIIRVGHLAAMREERVSVKEFGDIDAYLIEARSIGGLSGSPVFLNFGTMRLLDGEHRLANGRSPHFLLLGLIHGHFEPKVSATDSIDDDQTETLADANLSEAKINAGIVIVVPFESIAATIASYPPAPSFTWKITEVKYSANTTLPTARGTA